MRRNDSARLARAVQPPPTATTISSLSPSASICSPWRLRGTISPLRSSATRLPVSSSCSQQLLAVERLLEAAGFAVDGECDQVGCSCGCRDKILAGWRVFCKPRRRHSATAPDSLTTLPQRAVSSRRNSANCAGVLVIGSVPMVASFSFVSAAATILAKAWLRRAMIGWRRAGRREHAVPQHGFEFGVARLHGSRHVGQRRRALRAPESPARAACRI